MEKTFEKMREFFNKSTKGRLVFVLGIIGILLIGFSSVFKEQKISTASTSSAITDEQYCNELEKKVAELVTAITGDKKCIVAVTLENGSQYVYADQNKIDSDQTEDKTGNDIKTKETHKTEQEYIIVKDEGGAQTALIVTEKKPSVRGVAIVSNGVNDATKQHILESVASMLGVADRKISITPKNGF